ncbi:matrix metalloproteinase-11 [Pseudomonas capeferrum]|uniref:matrixin family metalloprotease n=1 Tax=Pseudomonas capeferrum TaxID=1495066 RepID=UPI0015E42498|nr:matrixin family metalloprotease [Pseudomonas capeferrum]MBA1203196.1 matrix metalloproteinase-11 [Pseudomonas capeferrum]
MAPKIRSSSKNAPADPFRLKADAIVPADEDSQVHRYGAGEHIICDTESRGCVRNIAELQLDATQGFIPLWAEGAILRWRFKEQSLARFEAPEEVKAKIEALLCQALRAWGDAVPVAFARDDDAWDFQIVIQEIERCDAQGACVLASAFFPDPGRHDLVIYPTLFKQDLAEQVETIAHELGHVFGLRHWFAPQHEAAFPSIPYGSRKRVSIMNYGPDSQLTDEDRNDLIALYADARSGKLTHINGTPIRLVAPFHTLRERSPVVAMV